jgi:hypothetical protein
MYSFHEICRRPINQTDAVLFLAFKQASNCTDAICIGQGGESRMAWTMCRITTGENTKTRLVPVPPARHGPARGFNTDTSHRRYNMRVVCCSSCLSRLMQTYIQYSSGYPIIDEYGRMQGNGNYMYAYNWNCIERFNINEESPHIIIHIYIHGRTQAFK